ncbi:hypothetical protein ACL02O_33100 [Micromonospora sp. MS34]|uniref:hypothetical protein n=1 Tax=Micromonospora sp. MS34 TaxID=3385971 RepID=UPI0039A1F480
MTADQRTAFEKFGVAAVIRSGREFASAEAIGAAVAAIVLVVTFESLVVAGMTLLMIGVGVGMAGLFALSGVVLATTVRSSPWRWASTTRS